MSKQSKETGVTAIMYLAMLTIGVILIYFVLTFLNNKNLYQNNVMTSTGSQTSISDSTDEETIEKELMETEVEFPEDELMQMEAELEAL